MFTSLTGCKSVTKYLFSCTRETISCFSNIFKEEYISKSKPDFKFKCYFQVHAAKLVCVLKAVKADKYEATRKAVVAANSCYSAEF